MIKHLRITAILLAILCLIGGSLPVLADIIWVPDDDFLTLHRAECTYGPFRLYVPREEQVSIYNEPHGEKICTRGEGDRIGARWIYSGGDEFWAYLHDEENEIFGWFFLGDVYRFFDGYDFDDLHEDEYYTQPERHFSIKSGTLYEYPCGPVINNKWEQSGASDSVRGFPRIFKDDKGREWGYMSYMPGTYGAWICLDDPENDTLSEFGRRLVDPITAEVVGDYITDNDTEASLTGDAEITFDPFAAQTEGPGEEKQTIDPNAAADMNRETIKEGNKSPWLIAGIVAAAAAACAAVLGVCFKKRSERK